MIITNSCSPQADDLEFPRPEEQLDFNGERYTSSISGPIRHQHHHRYLFATRFCLGLDILDVACGEGYGSALLSTVARSVIGVDLDEATVDFARRNYVKDNLSFRKGDAANIQDRESFDVVVSFETIEHLVEHQAFMIGVKNALRADGLLIISSPDKDVYTLEDGHENEFHLKELTRPQFDALIRGHFKNVAILEQDSIVGSFIGLDGGAPADLELHSSVDGQAYRRTLGAPRAHYLIAVASDGPLPQLFTSALNDMAWVGEQQGHQTHAVALAREVGIRDIEITRLQGEAAALAREVGVRDTEITRLQGEVAAAQIVIQHLEDVVSERTAEVDVMRTEVERLQDRNTRGDVRIQHLESAREAKDAEIGRLREQADETTTQIADLRREMDQTYAIVAEQKRHIGEVLTSTSWRLSAPVRHIGRLTANARRRVHMLVVPPSRQVAKVRQNRVPRILFIDWTVPTPDQDSGSLDLWHQLKMFQAIGYDVSFMSIIARVGDPLYLDAMQNSNVDYVAVPADSSPEQVLQERAGEFDLFILNRIHVAERLLAHVRRCAPNVRIVFNTVDLHFLREEREAALEGCQEKARAAAQRRVSELRCMSEADATIVLSEEEGRMLAGLVPEATIHIIPFARNITSDCPDFSERSGVLFVGGFLHTPNIDGAIWLTTDIWPKVRRALPHARLDIVGSNATHEVRQLADPDSGIFVRGFVQELEPILSHARLTVAPLRFGAGIKGKVAMSLAAGLPCVATPIASEGMGLVEDRSILVGRDVDEIAGAIIRLHEDPLLWSRLSEEGKVVMRSRYSFESVGKRFITLMRSLDMHVEAGAEERVASITPHF
ncbi:glycosyltransferase [Methylobacterium sp. SD274]|uniref:glycosyltransferase n=1 Tax=Methylobacterium sp. SD274 TaxID=2782009 RepID=UPI001A96F849|nr:glycosyltransferase [Methylobacterium sp. SD274]MBO1020553.1 glycosyltransferase [Methylobacterium sp. SD274]